MRRHRLARERLPAFVFLVSALLLAGALAMSDAFARGARTTYGAGGFHVDAQRGAFAIDLAVHRGERLLLEPDLPLGSTVTFASYDLYVTTEGGAEALLEGRAPERVYLHLADRPVLERCCPRADALSFDRPDGPDGPAFWVPGTPPTIFWPPGSPQLLEIVWIYHYRPGAQPQTPEEEAVLRELHTARVEAGMGTWWTAPTVVPRYAVLAQPFLVAIEMVAAAAAASSALAYLWTLRRRPEAPPGGATGTEALLGLHREAGAHLLGLRDLLVGGLLSFLLVLLAIASWDKEGSFLHLGARGAFDAWVRPVMEATLLGLILILVGAWLFLLFQVHRALRRWRRRAALPPLDL